MASKANITLIHIAKSQLRMIDDVYRAMLFNITGKESSKDLSDRQAVKVLEHFKSLGWVQKGKGGPAWTPSEDKQIRMIFYLWGKLHKAGKIKEPSKLGLRHYVKRMTGTDVLEWLSKEQKSEVIEALKQWLER